jgi:hypothetical protein
MDPWRRFPSVSKNLLCNDRVFNFTKTFKNYFMSLPKFKNLIVKFTASSKNRFQKSELNVIT